MNEDEENEHEEMERRITEIWRHERQIQETIAEHFARLDEHVAELHATYLARCAKPEMPVRPEVPIGAGDRAQDDTGDCIVTVLGVVDIWAIVRGPEDCPIEWLAPVKALTRVGPPAEARVGDIVQTIEDTQNIRRVEDVHGASYDLSSARGASSYRVCRHEFRIVLRAKP